MWGWSEIIDSKTGRNSIKEENKVEGPISEINKSKCDRGEVSLLTIITYFLLMSGYL